MGYVFVDKVGWIDEATAGTGAQKADPLVGTGVTTRSYVDAKAFSSGDVKLTFKTTADSGWVLMDDKSIGDGSSGASGRANADTVDLYTLLWTNVIDTWCPVSSGRGASAAADFAAHKTLTLPKTLGRALARYGSGSGLTARVLGEKLGEETHVQTTGELASHTHTWNNDTGGSGGNTSVSGAGTAATHTPSVTSTGSSTPFNVMQPTMFLNVMIKL